MVQQNSVHGASNRLAKQSIHTGNIEDKAEDLQEYCNTNASSQITEDPGLLLKKKAHPPKEKKETNTTSHNGNHNNNDTHTHTHTHARARARVENRETRTKQEKRLEKTPQGQQCCPERLSVCQRLRNVMRSQCRYSPSPDPNNSTEEFASCPTKAISLVYTHTHVGNRKKTRAKAQEKRLERLVHTHTHTHTHAPKGGRVLDCSP